MATSTPSAPTGSGLPEEQTGSLLQKGITLFMIAAPPVGIAAMWRKGWPFKPTKTDLKVGAVMHVVSAAGITIGFHRHFTHRSFKTSRLMRAILAIAGQFAIEGPLINWVPDHRKHHAFADLPGDPHSPHVGHGSGIIGMLKGLWHAHLGWLLSSPQSDRERYAPDLLKDSDVVRISKLFPACAVAAYAIPFGIGAVRTKSLKGALGATFWAGLIRMGFTHHITWSVNSAAHMFGKRRFDTDDHSTNILVLALPSLGETIHNGHHAEPTNAYNGHSTLERSLDVSGLTIRAMERVGLVWDVVSHSEEEIARKLAEKRAAKLASQAT